MSGNLLPLLVNRYLQIVPNKISDAAAAVAVRWKSNDNVNNRRTSGKSISTSPLLLKAMKKTKKVETTTTKASVKTKDTSISKTKHKSAPFSKETKIKHQSFFCCVVPTFETLNADMSSATAKLQSATFSREKRNNLLHKKSPIEDVHLPAPSFKTNEPRQPKSNDLVVDIKGAQSVDQLLDIAVKQGSQLKSVHLVDIFHHILIFQQNPKTQLDLQVLQKNEGFIILCHRLRKLAPTIRKRTELIDCLKTLVFCEVNETSRLICTLLELLKDRVKELSLRNIFLLCFLLKKLFNSSSLQRELQTALVLSFEYQLETQLQRDNGALLLDIFQFACTYQVSRPKMKFIVDSLLATDPNKWSPNQVLSALRSMERLSQMKKIGLDLFDDLLQATLKRLAELVDQCKQEDLLRVLLNLSKVYEWNNRSWYNQQFCEKVAERAVRERWSLYASSRVAQTHSVFSFVHAEVLEYLSTLIVRHKDISQKDPSYLLVPFASTSYKPVNFKAVMDVLLSSDLLKTYQAASPKINKNQFWFRFIVRCAILDSYPKELIGDVFKKHFFEEYLNEDHPLFHWVEMNRALRSVRIECPDYQGFFPDPTFLEVANQKTFEYQQKHQRTMMVEETLQKALGGSPYVASGLMTRHGHFVDHALVMRPGGFPVAISLYPKKEDTFRYVEDIGVPNGCQLMLIQAFRPTDYLINSNHLNGINVVDLRTLRLLGYDVITFNTNQLSELREHQRIPFLMHEIDQRLKVLTIL